MLRVLEQAFLVGHDGGDYVGTWLDGTPGQIEGGPFGRDFPLTFISSKPDGQCNAQTAISLLTLKSALGIALIRFSFSVLSFGKRVTRIGVIYMHIVHLFFEFWLVNTWFFAHWRNQHAGTRLENVRHLNKRRSKKLGFQLSHSCLPRAFKPCPLEISSNGRLKQEPVESCPLTTKSIVSPLPQCLWPTNLWLTMNEWWLTMKDSNP